MDLPIAPVISESLSSRAQHPIFGYTFRSDQYYEAIISWLKKRYHWKITREMVSFSPGVVSGLAQCIELFSKPGDKVILQSPVYPPFFEIIEKLDRQIINNRLKLVDGKYRMDLDRLRDQIDDKTRLLLFCNPHNPVGRVWEKNELLLLAEICLQHRILILSDEIHADLILGDVPFTPLGSLSPEIAVKTISFMSPSKSFNLAGLSTSFLVFGDSGLRKKYQRRINHLHLANGNLFGFLALEIAYLHGEEWLNALLQFLKDNLSFATGFLQRFLPEVKIIHPEGTFLLWLDFNTLGLNDNELRLFLINEARLGLMHGPDFGPGGEGFQRLNFGCGRKKLEEALTRLHLSIKRLHGNYGQ
jgi:cystathionine beta-lyase